MQNSFVILFFLGVAACVLYCGAYAAFCAWAKRPGACVCATVLTLLSGGALALLILYILGGY